MTKKKRPVKRAPQPSKLFSAADVVEGTWVAAKRLYTERERHLMEKVATLKAQLHGTFYGGLQGPSRVRLSLPNRRTSNYNVYTFDGGPDGAPFGTLYISRNLRSGARVLLEVVVP